MQLEQPAAFKAAKPIWAKGREREMNLQLGFRAKFTPIGHGPTILRIAGWTLYRIFVNGEFFGYGPARGPHVFYRVDEWPLTHVLRSGENTIAIEVAGYNVNSYYVVDEPSFLQAEIEEDGRVLVNTGDTGGFAAIELKHRVQKVARYSFQRPFSEVYHMKSGDDRWWETDELWHSQEVPLAVTAEVKLLPRRISFPRFELRQPSDLVSSGKMTPIEIPDDKLWRDRSMAVDANLRGYPEKELTEKPSLEFQRLQYNAFPPADKVPTTQPTRAALNDNEARIVDFGTDLTGFIGLTVTCNKPVRLLASFDEILSDGKISFHRLGTTNLVEWKLTEPGTYRLEAFEPYTMRYLQLTAIDGSCQIEKISLREYANPDFWQAEFVCDDFNLVKIFDAARQTCRQNALDVFMDCPSRERAGWLCDSFFTARVAHDLSGHATLERNFIENFALAGHVRNIPDAMFPMCYPADHDDGTFIPQWAMWLVLQIDEYLGRSGDRALVDQIKPKIENLLKFFKGFQNSDGLLEKLPSWCFIEWSDANQFVQDVSYPTNMLYATVLSAAGRLYDRKDWLTQAEQIRATVLKQSFDGHFFVDNAVRDPATKKLNITTNRSEVCQYFAFFFDVATPQSHPDLWKTLCEEFGPTRKQTKKHPEIHYANAFIGNYLRLEVLSRFGRSAQVVNECNGYFLNMANLTGTLWENDSTVASCNHGFASHIARVLFRDALGIKQIDPVNRTVHIRFDDTHLTWRQGRIPVPGGFVSVRWQKRGDIIDQHVDAPAGYAVQIETT